MKPANQTLLNICSSVRKQIPLSKYRARRPRPKDHKTWEALTDYLISGLAHVMARDGEGAYLHVSTALRNRADAQDYPAALRSTLMKPLIHALEDRGFIKVILAERFMRTTIQPTDKFIALLNQSTITPQDFTHDNRMDVVRMKHHKRIKGEADPWVEFPETKHTRRLGAAVKRINALLAAADISLTRPVCRKVKGTLRSTDNVDVSQRHLWRQFATFDGQPRWDLHGRLYGGFWMNMEEVDRSALRINGEPIADLDFSTMHLRLLYHRAGLERPEGDLYAIPGWEGHRLGIKKVLNALINKPRLRNWPDHEGERGGTRDLFPEGTKLAAVRGPILDHHPVLKTVDKETGFALAFIESEILMSVLLTLADAGIPALPMHDGLMVQQSKGDLAEAVMIQASERVAGVALPVKRKALI